MSARLLIFAVLAATQLARVSDAPGQPVPVGPEFQVNVVTTGDQSPNAVASDDVGGFVVIWQDDEIDALLDTRARLYANDGSPASAPFAIAAGPGAQGLGDVASDSVGNFVAAWVAGDADGLGVFARRHDASGAPVGSAFQVNTHTTGSQAYPAVAVADDGRFIVTWESVPQDGSGQGIYAQRYDAMGAPDGTEFRVNTYTTGIQRSPSVAYDSAARSVILWWGASTSDDFGVVGQRYDAAGTPLAGEFLVNDATTGTQSHPKVSYDGDGRFVVAWSSPGINSDVFARRFDANAVALTPELEVNSFTTGLQVSPVVVADASGSFMVAWSSAGQDGDNYGVFARRYTRSDVPQGPEFQINTHTTGIQAAAHLAADLAGRFTVVWTSVGQDGDGSGVFGRRYTVGDEAEVQSVAVGGTATTDDESDGATAVDVIETTVTSPQAGTIAIVEDDITEAVAGFTLLGLQVSITAPAASPSDPLALLFELDASIIPPGSNADDVALFRDGALVPDCTGAPGTASPDPCVTERQFEGDGDLLIAALTSNASEWNFGIAVPPTTSTTTSSTSSSSSSTSSTSTSTSSSSSSSSSTSSTSSTSTTAPESTSSSTMETSSTMTSTTSSSTSTAPTAASWLVPGRVALIRPAALAKFISRPASGDAFTLPSAAFLADGGELRIFDIAGTAGDDTYALAAGIAWKALGNPPGSNGYKYKGAGTPSDPCKVVLIKKTVIKGVCKGSGIALTPPFDGDIGIVLSLGATDRYCAEFGGDETNNDATLTKRKNAPAPGACP